jgi:uncharacterized protein YigA (DUF484 family)
MTDERTSLKEVVAKYLRKHPDFLNNHPDILELLEIDHESGVAVSLIERQVNQLRASNEELEKQLSRLVRVATENEELMSRLHRLTLELMLLDNREAFFTHLGKSLLDDFNADTLRVFLLNLDIAAEAGENVIGIAPDDPALEPFSSLLEKGQTHCGRLNESKLDFLFGDKAPWVQSTALMPLGDNGSLGLMAIGSSDENRFYPGMGTLFLDLLADVISTNLDQGPPEAQRRSA